MYQGESTNFSNVNMLAIALATLGRIETDPGARATLSDLIDKFWDAGDSRSAVHLAQPWYDVIASGFGRAPRAEVPARMRQSLGAYAPPPTLQRDRVNCDDAEIAARACVAVDGTTALSLSDKRGHGGIVVATAPVPIAVRPDSDFLWRGDPYAVNEGASNRLNPRGDWLAAYWLGRLLDRDPSKNLSPTPAPTPDDPASPGDGSSGGQDTPRDGDASAADGGCACTMHASNGSGPALALTALALTALSRRRSRLRR
jgi:hypothetical protein